MIFIIVDLGKKLKHLRSVKKLTQVQVAERIYITKGMVSSYETDIRVPSYDVLIKFAALYGVTTDYLLGFDKAKMIDVSGLTDSQVDSILNIINEYKKLNGSE